MTEDDGASTAAGDPLLGYDEWLGEVAELTDERRRPWHVCDRKGHGAPSAAAMDLRLHGWDETTCDVPGQLLEQGWCAVCMDVRLDELVVAGTRTTGWCPCCETEWSISEHGWGMTLDGAIRDAW